MNKEHINLNALRDRAYQTAKDHGFHETEHSDEHYLMLVITELSEAVEADRRGRNAQIKTFVNDPAITHLKPDHDGIVFQHRFNEYIKDTVEDELADTVIRLLDMAGVRGAYLDLMEGIDIPNIPFPELIFKLCKAVAFTSGSDASISHLISCIFTLCKHLNINILWHIEHKMIYNESRIKKHGKKY